MKVVNMHEAKTTLSQLVEQAEKGEEIVLARAASLRFAPRVEDASANGRDA